MRPPMFERAVNDSRHVPGSGRRKRVRVANFCNRYFERRESEGCPCAHRADDGPLHRFAVPLPRKRTAVRGISSIICESHFANREFCTRDGFPTQAFICSGKCFTRREGDAEGRRRSTIRRSPLLYFGAWPKHLRAAEWRPVRQKTGRIHDLANNLVWRSVRSGTCSAFSLSPREQFLRNGNRNACRIDRDTRAGHKMRHLPFPRTAVP